MGAAFTTGDFLLSSEEARRLFHEYAAPSPIIDFHSHLPVARLAGNTGFENISRLWLSGDHYKWRQMRANGIDERYCTGEASDWEKFQAWALTVPRMLRNPLYHWTHLELARVFGVDDVLLGPDTARTVWERCNAVIRDEAFTARELVRRMNVEVLCTTDDPVDSLVDHRALAADTGFATRVLPAFRPDRALDAGRPQRLNEWLDLLSETADSDINTFASMIEALRKRHEYFHRHGCRLSDHGIKSVPTVHYDVSRAEKCFARVRGGASAEPADIAAYQAAVLHECALMDWERGWAQQLHIGALRDNNTRMFEKLGPDTGFDAIADEQIARPLSRFLDRLDREGKLPKTVVYNLNPRDNELVGALLGCFNDGSTAGKMQMGSAWWFLDHKDGMERQLEALSNTGLLSRFVGMVTDSRSFLSFPRHEYFRRILCNLLGEEMHGGLLPSDMDLVGETVSDICCGNARSYFGFPSASA